MGDLNFNDLFKELENPVVSRQLSIYSKEVIFVTRYYIAMEKIRKDGKTEVVSANDAIMKVLNLNIAEYKVYIKKFQGRYGNLPRFKNIKNAMDFINSVAVISKMQTMGDKIESDNIG